MLTHPESESAQALRILHLEDCEADHALVARVLSKSTYAATLSRVETLDAFGQALTQQNFDLVLADYRLPGFTALQAWDRMRELEVRLPFVLLSGAIGESAAVAAIQAGISDYLPKEDLSKLPHVIERALATHQLLLAKERADRELAQSERQLAQFAEHLQNTIEQERAAIAREIHDDIGGSLAAIRFDLSWIARHTQDEAVRAHVQSATEMLQHAVGASQRIMRNLRPAILDQGLGAALNWLASEFAKRTHIEVQVHTPSHTLTLPKAVQLTAYRTAQEALTNVGKYAQATRVRLDLSDGEGVLTLEVSDNGCGLSPEQLTKPQSFGLRGLRERARSVGGWLDISAQPGRGTSIILSIPLNTPDAQETP
ncbi:MAG: hypothetical protein OHK0048_19490 [Rhodoferax sp.]